MAERIKRGRRYRVRYQKFSGWSPWRECGAAHVRGEVLRILIDDTHEVLVPMHVIRGEIEIEEVSQEASNA